MTWVYEGEVLVPAAQQEAYRRALAVGTSMGAVVAFSGHRPDKLLSAATSVYRWLLGRLEVWRPAKAISGMARGADTLGAIAALKLGIPLVAAVPFEGQDALWVDSDRQVYRRILDRAAEVVYVSDPGYAAWKMHARNHWMVDRADLVLAAWDGSGGGTKACVEYALKKRVLVERFLITDLGLSLR